MERHILSRELRRGSIRHLAVAGRDTVAFVCQYPGDAGNLPPLMGFHRRGETLQAFCAPDETQATLKNYIGSVTADSGGTVVAASAPRGGVVIYWDPLERRFLGSCSLRDGCRVAPTHRGATFLLTSGEGWLVPGGADGLGARRSTRFHWDNRAILVR